MSSMSAMSIFGTTFTEQSKELHEVEAEHKRKLRDAGSSSALRRRIEHEHKKDIQRITNDILDVDKKLRLYFPFTLSTSVKEMLKANPGYYIHDRIIEVGERCTCVVCNRRFATDDIFVEDVKSNAQCCLMCADTNCEVDGEQIQLKITEADYE